MKHLDKLKHLGCFSAGFLLMLVLLRSFFPDISEMGRIAAAATFQAAAAWITEDRQRHQPGRVKDGWDAFADMVGIPVGLFAYMALQHFGIL